MDEYEKSFNLLKDFLRVTSKDKIKEMVSSLDKIDFGGSPTVNEYFTSFDQEFDLASSFTHKSNVISNTFEVFNPLFSTDFKFHNKIDVTPDTLNTYTLFCEAGNFNLNFGDIFSKVERFSNLANGYKYFVEKIEAEPENTPKQFDEKVAETTDSGYKMAA